MLGHALGIASAAEETGTVRGVVRNQEAANEPVEGARVQVVGTELQAVSAADGTYRIDGVPAGNQTLEVTREGMARARIPVVVRGGETSEAPVFLTPAEVVDIMVFGRQRQDTAIGLLSQRQKGP